LKPAESQPFAPIPSAANGLRNWLRLQHHPSPPQKWPVIYRAMAIVRKRPRCAGSLQPAPPLRPPQIRSPES